MFRFLVLLLALATVAHGGLLREQRDVGRIVGGENADIEDIPYQLFLLYNLQQICGAVLISKSWALTAAHCTATRTTGVFHIRGGISNRLFGGYIRHVVQVINHPNFDLVGAFNDIGLLRLAEDLDLDSTIQPIALPSQGEEVPVGALGLVSGWGRLNEHSSLTPNILQQVLVPIVSQTACNIAYRGAISEGMLCAGWPEGGKDACSGDSGGPLAVDGVLVGIVSFGNGCARANVPGVYARVPVFRDWIASITGI